MRPTYISLPFTFLSCASIAIAQCTLNIPQNPLTAQGLATPYELTGCNQLDFANEGVFVEAAIIDPATGQIQIYNPLVINAGMTAVGTSSNTSTSTSTSTSKSSSSTSTSSSSSARTTSGSSSVKNGNTGTTTSTTSSSTSPSSSSSVKTSNGSASTIASTHTTSGGATLTQAARAAATTGAGFFIPPIVPTLPANAVVALWFGSNAQTVTLTGDTATCVNGLGTSVFGQFAYCNAPAWFSAANAAVQNGMTKVPSPGTGSGQACPTIRDFRIVDQDQSDNVVTTYLMIGTNTLAQNTPANSQANPDAEVLSNASDNALNSEFIQPSLGCTPYSNPCTTCSKGQSPALATNELQASFFPPVGGPAMVPLNDPMVLVDGQQSLQKVNLYRAGVNQAQADNANASGTTYCQQFAQSGLFISLNQQLFSGTTSPAADQATNLFTFLAMRFSMSFGPVPGLACTQLLNVVNPVTLTTDGNGIVTAATINTQALQQILGGVTTTSTATTSATQSGVRLVSTSSGATTATLSTMTASNTTSMTRSSVQSVSTSSTAVTASKTSSATHSTVQSVSSSTAITTSKATSATHSSIQSASSSTAVTTSKATSATHSSVQSVSASTALTTSKATSATHSSVQSVSSSTAVTTSKATSATHSSVQSASVPSATATATTPATSATHSSSLSISTSSRTATMTSATTTSHATTTSVAVTSPTTVATGITSSGVCTSTVTVTVTATVCPSSTSQTTSQTTSHHYSGQGGGHYWLRGLPAREHSRMQKKNRHSSDW